MTQVVITRHYYHLYTGSVIAYHHGVSERGEEVEERLALLAKLGKGNAKDDRKEDQAKDV